jgi:gas vesicle protein
VKKREKMRNRNEPAHRDHFWSGFVFGAAIGGTLGVLLASELGRTAREKLETAVIDVCGRMNGTTESPDLEVEEAEEETPS